MSEPTRPTIFALSSGRPPAAIAVIRISGPRAGDALRALGVKIPEPRKAALARIRDSDNEVIDEALALWFPAPNSETGEDTAELQLHGGRAVIAGVLDALGRVDGLRMAEPGEFTRRAFENGKLDLTAIEGLADLIGAETQGQRRQAFRQMKGLLGGRAETWRQRLIQALALVEARIDFSDEGDVPENLVGPAVAIARELAEEIGAALADGGRGERLREGLVVAIAGPPNAGKSTLLNRLAQREAAIVSPYAGTTRDVIEVHLELSGMPVTLLDTAGIRETDDPVELEGVRRARDRAAGADLVLWVVDASEAGGPMADHSPVLPGRRAEARSGEGGRTRTPEAASEPTPGFRVPASGRRRNDERLSQTDADSAAPAGSIFADRGYRFGGPNDASVPDAATMPETAGPTTALPPPAPSAAPNAPPMWLIRNKIDLIQYDSSNSEPSHQEIGKSEPIRLFNKPLTDMVNSELPHKSEAKPQTNNPLTDMVNPRLTGKSEPVVSKSDETFNLSATSCSGFDLLLARLARYAQDFLAGAESSLVTRARHRHALEETLAALGRAIAPDTAGREDLLAEELRIAARALGRLTGRVDVEDILDVIFRDFCIGK
ncbi:MAG TPA: tRNA uridine-5-carboxymethylaminomethyl(34) synthesis GTPase MnmE [Pseudolabrys sp.]|nr:tRNA uridine-5-carboxymethylaminomethyl(34) synthesis GTPase MnmE [Pseudolabrys sp.]